MILDMVEVELIWDMQAKHGFNYTPEEVINIPILERVYTENRHFDNYQTCPVYNTQKY